MRLSDISELLEFPTLMPSPSSGPRDASSRELEEGEHPEDTRNKMSHLCIFFVVIVDCILHLMNNDDRSIKKIFIADDKIIPKC